MALTAVEEAQLRDLIAQQSALLSLAGVEATILSKLGATKVTLSDLPSATAINDADLLLLRQGTTDKSVTGLTFKGLIPTVVDASETVKGIVELATDAEAQAGTDTARAITPANLSSRTATETRTGVIELATDAEVQTATDTSRAITPAGFGSAALGQNQTWQDVYASRVAGTTYTNSTGRPIMVAIMQASTGTQNFYIDGVKVGAQVMTSTTTATLTFIIPNGSTYRCDTSKGTSWFELR